VKETLQNLLMGATDTLFSAIPQRQPPRVSLQRCKLISHRGEHDNKTVFENTLAAFRAAREAGVWGIECDIRWTADLVPVVVHDPDGGRVFGDPAPIRELTFAQLRRRLPSIPSLEELLSDYGGYIHLMLEIKAEPLIQPRRQKEILAELLRDLDPVGDYHFLALNPDLFHRVDFAPRCSCIPVAEFNISALSEHSLASGYGGLAGHYVLLTSALKWRHEAAGQRVGVGHIGSRNALFRELNRGVEWIFSNNAVAMQRLLDELLQ
jgi:glycerophosphoryl diester phosphodiesterase